MEIDNVVILHEVDQLSSTEKKESSSETHGEDSNCELQVRSFHVVKANSSGANDRSMLIPHKEWHDLFLQT